MINKIFFAYFSITIIILSMIVVTRRNVMHSVLYMLILFFHIASLYLFLNAEFIAAIQIIVYAGAIMVLFLFVIMLLNIREDIKDKHFTVTWPFGFLITCGIMSLLFLVSTQIITGQKGIWSVSAVEKTTNTMALGKVLFTEYMLPFEVASLVLLVALIGAIVFAKKKI
ncbi:NADH-ubiquinone/plastoquinone oxidoreductase chain 6 [Candidatus Magnetoovum chiemensis]|nr:NADH-ubiquinone/plastoquinone oxidoreductase chain 6 [Candidatus Magnetoovum chiemensis]